jgi:hypothetical protein
MLTDEQQALVDAALERSRAEYESAHRRAEWRVVTQVVSGGLPGHGKRA